MSDVDSIKSIEELRKAQAAANQHGTSIANYDQWQQVLEDFETVGIQSTGSFEGDMRLHAQIIKQIESFIEEVQAQEKAQAQNPQNNEASKLDNQTSTDKEQVVKSNVANATSSIIMADYMKYYHLL